MRRRGSVLRRLLAVGSAVAVALALTACGPAAGPTHDAVAMQAADGGPGQDGTDGADGSSRGGDGGHGGDASTMQPLDSVVAKASAKQRTCMTRNRDVVEWRDTDLLESTGWRKEGRQKAHEQVTRSVYKRLGVYTRFGGGRSPQDDVLLSGLLGYDLDPVGSRLIMLLDPSIVDVPEFRRWVAEVAQGANADVGVGGRSLTVTVQEGCFSARELRAAKQYVMRNNQRLQMSWMENWVRLDGRVHMAFVERASVEKVQRRLGPVAAVEQSPMGLAR